MYLCGMYPIWTKSRSAVRNFRFDSEVLFSQCILIKPEKGSVPHEEANENWGMKIVFFFFPLGSSVLSMRCFSARVSESRRFRGSYGKCIRLISGVRVVILSIQQKIGVSRGVCRDDFSQLMRIIRSCGRDERRETTLFARTILCTMRHFSRSESFSWSIDVANLIFLKGCSLATLATTEVPCNFYWTRKGDTRGIRGGAHYLVISTLRSAEEICNEVKKKTRKQNAFPFGRWIVLLLHLLVSACIRLHSHSP